MLRIKLTQSPIGNKPRNRATVQALGLRHVQQVVEHEDTPTIRGMIHHVKHMLSVEEVETTAAAKPTPLKANAKKEAAAKVAKTAAAEALAAKEGDEQ